MVTPSACSTTSILTLSASARRADLCATTSTWLPLAGVAEMSPFTPLISMLLPAATALLQLHGVCALAGTEASVSETTAKVRCVSFIGALRYSLTLTLIFGSLGFRGASGIVG